MEEGFGSIARLVGQTLLSIDRGDDTLTFHCSDGKTFKMFHSQDCCEHVYLDDVVGDLDDLVGHKILEAYEETNSSDRLVHSAEAKDNDESFTWTFYRIATIKGTVTLKWYGSSNGYYSESVDFVEI